MFGSNAFGVLAFGFVDVPVAAVAPPTPSSPTVVAHLVGIAEAFAVVARDVVVAVVAREPSAVFLPTMRGPT